MVGSKPRHANVQRMHNVSVLVSSLLCGRYSQEASGQASSRPKVPLPCQNENIPTLEYDKLPLPYYSHYMYVHRPSLASSLHVTA
jgi:hypothetical protein